MNFDPYEILGVSRDADLETIKKNYRALVKQTHPDVNPGNLEAEEKFKKISQAWETLSDPEKRQQYDMQENLSRGRGGPFPFESFFKEAFGPFGGPTPGGFATPEELPKPEKLHGSDLSVVLGVSPIDILLGETITSKYTRLVYCEVCGGKGSDFIKCGNCSGKGLIFQTNRQGHFISQTARSCQACMGFGWVKQNACEACGGTGLFPKEQDISVSLSGISGPVGHVEKFIPGSGNYGAYGGPPGNLILSLNIIFPDQTFLTPEVKELLLKIKTESNGAEVV